MSSFSLFEHRTVCYPTVGERVGGRQGSPPQSVPVDTAWLERPMPSPSVRSLLDELRSLLTQILKNLVSGSSWCAMCAGPLMSSGRICELFSSFFVITVALSLSGLSDPAANHRTVPPHRVMHSQSSQRRTAHNVDNKLHEYFIEGPHRTVTAPSDEHPRLRKWGEGENGNSMGLKSVNNVDLRGTFQVVQCREKVLGMKTVR